jgi:hypothetical protein
MQLEVPQGADRAGERLNFFLDWLYKRTKKKFCEESGLSSQALLSQYLKKSPIYFTVETALKFERAGLAASWLLFGKGSPYADNDAGQRLRAETGHIIYGRSGIDADKSNPSIIYLPVLYSVNNNTTLSVRQSFSGLHISSNFLHDMSKSVAIYVSGDDMAGDGIFEADILLCMEYDKKDNEHADIESLHRSLVIFNYSGATYLRRLICAQDGSIIFAAARADIPQIIISADSHDEYSIIALPYRLIGSVNRRVFGGIPPVA